MNKYAESIMIPNGLSIVTDFENKIGIINKKGKEIVKPKYDEIYFVSDKFALVKLNDKIGFIDKQGKEIVPLKYIDTIIHGGEKFLYFKDENNNIGFLNVDNPIVEYPFTASMRINNDEILYYGKYINTYVIKINCDIYSLDRFKQEVSQMMFKSKNSNKYKAKAYMKIINKIEKESDK